MPNLLSDDELDFLDSSPEEDQHTFLSSIPEQDALDVANAVAARRSTRTGVSVRVGMPEMQPITQDTARPTQTFNVGDLAADVGRGMLQTANDVKDRYIAPVVEKVQGAIKPVADAALSLGGFGSSPGIKTSPTQLKAGIAPTAQPDRAGTPEAALLRSALSTYAGSQVVQDDPAAVAALQQEFGDKAELMMAGAKMAGQGPLLFVGPGWVKGAGEVGEAAGALAATAKVAPRVARLLGAAGKQVGEVVGAGLENAAVNTTAALGTRGKKLEDAAEEGFVGGAALGGGLKVLGGVAKGAAALSKPVAVFGRKAVRFLADELEAMGAQMMPEGAAVEGVMQTRAKVVEGLEKHVPETPARRVEKVDKPSIAAVVATPEGLVGRVVELKPNEVPAYVDMPLRTPEEQMAFGNLVRKNDVSVTRSSEALKAMGTMPDDMLNRITGTPTIREIDELEIRASVAAAKAKGKGTPAETPRAKAATPDLDAPPPSLDDQEVHFVVENGQLVGRDTPTEELRTPTPPTDELPAVGSPLLRDMSPEELAGIKGAGPKVAQSPDLVPQPVPKPDRPFMPGDLEPHQIAEVQAASELADTLRKKLPPSLWEKAWNQLVPPHLRGKADIASLVSMGEMAKKGVKPDGYFELLKKRLPSKQLWTAFDRDIAQLAEGKLKTEDMEVRHGPLWKEVRKYFEPMLTRVQELDRRIAELGGISDDLIALRDQGALDQYLARMYRAYYLPKGEWARIAPQHLIDGAVDFLYREATQPGGSGWNRSQIVREVQDMLGSEDPIQHLLKSGAVGGNWKNLLRRKEIPAPLRALMGEENSGAVRLSATLAKQESIVRNLEFWQMVSSRSDVFSPELTATHSVHIPPMAAKYGKAAGGYVTPEVGALLNGPNFIKDQHGFISALNSLGGYVKGNEIARGGLKPWVNNVLGNFWYSTLAGGLDPLTHPRNTAKGFYHAALAMKSFRENGGISGLGMLVKEAEQFGLDLSGFGQNEMSGQSPKVLRALEDAILRKPVMSHYDQLKAMAKVVGEKSADGFNAPSAAYDYIDRYFKLANYIALREKFVTKGKPLEEAAMLAAHRVNQSFPNSARPAPIADAVRSKGFGAVAKYFTFQAEDGRIHAMLPKRLSPILLDGSKNPNFEPDLMWRVLYMGGLMKGALKGMDVWRRENGISDEEVEHERKLRTARQAAYRPLLIALPFRDNDGRVQFIDASAVFAMSKFIQGHPRVPMAENVAMNVATAPVAGTPAEDWARTQAAKVGVGKPISAFEKPLLPGEDLTMAIFNQILDLGLAPRAIQRAGNDLRKAGVGGYLGKTEEPFTLGQAAANQAGFSVVPGNSGPMKAANAAEFKGDLAELRRQIQSVSTSGRGDEEKARIIDALNAEIDKRSAQQQEVDAAESAAKKRKTP